jgi:acid phosphatase type 7
MNTKMTAAFAGLVVGAVSACSANESGDLQAERFGDLSHLLTGGNPDTEIVVACGPATSPAGGSVLRRRPYLQQLTDRSAQILWVADRGAAAASVRLSLPDGSPAGEVTVTEDADASAPGGARQWVAAVEGLSPATTYCYEIRAGDALLRKAGFRTAPDRDRQTARFIALGDSGDGSRDQVAVTAQLRTVPFEFALHLGDLAYDSGTRGEIDGHYFQMYADLLEKFAMFPASGNHEYETEGAAPFREAFSLPANGGPQGGERWYSFDWGPAHLVALDTEQMVPAQAAWLDADLAASDRPWKVVYFHKPGFSSGAHGSNGPVQSLFVPVLVKHQVPLVLSGHDHDYERTTPIDGVTYVVTGGGGVGTRPVGSSSFTAFAESVCHFVYVTIDGDALTLHAIDATGQQFDSLVLRH